MKDIDGYSSLFFLLLGIAFLSQSLTLPLGTLNHPDSGFFPAIISPLFILLRLSPQGVASEEDVEGELISATEFEG